ncbi:MAG TPA: hypothetical protein EYP55_06595 [Anaerolineae bacterium]|nr:hypothetical protein [Anaerolineae bacterium]
MIELWLYGDLRRHAVEGSVPLKLPLAEGATIGEVLRRLDLAPEEISHIFLNGKLLFSRSSMATWLGYVEEKERMAQGFNPIEVTLRPGDRLGIFPRNMGMLVV